MVSAVFVFVVCMQGLYLYVCSNLEDERDDALVR